ncbi:uncharacterized protein LOC129598923 [Paramacrobiotus metropolitanus]|uniref:uncharacterized protein LOC129598923 n=1 Tax=Paramacrobiotus metropolitanus TaxID=2943436 RepID=UPI002445EF1F|nr:uncharacterized protein LOC129598923 [Paramacrobiotus metropolitanus]
MMSWLKRFTRGIFNYPPSNAPNSVVHGNLTRSVTLYYQIPTAQFAGKRSSHHDDYGRDYWIYSADFEVEKQWNYPEIPQSMWIVSMEVEPSLVTRQHLNTLLEGARAPRAKVAPKAGYSGLVSPYEITVEGKVSASNNDPFTCTSIAIGPTGWAYSAVAKDDTKLAHLMCCKTTVDENGHSHQSPALIAGYVYVRLTFRIQQHERHDLQRLLDSGLMADCTLVAQDGRKFSAHRAILAVQSPVLTEMLQNNKHDKISGLSITVDTDGALLEILVRFAYTRKVLHTADERLEELWMAADKFEMKELAAACECRMMAGVDVGNAMRYYAFARKFGLAKLQQSIARCIGKNPVDA